MLLCTELPLKVYSHYSLTHIETFYCRKLHPHLKLTNTWTRLPAKTSWFKCFEYSVRELSSCMQQTVCDYRWHIFSLVMLFYLQETFISQLWVLWWTTLVTASATNLFSLHFMNTLSEIKTGTTRFVPSEKSTVMFWVMCESSLWLEGYVKKSGSVWLLNKVLKTETIWFVGLPYYKMLKRRILFSTVGFI